MNCNIFTLPIAYKNFLLPSERLFYFRVVINYQLNQHRAVEMPSTRWAESLGIYHQEKSRLRNKIFRVQKSLETKRFLKVIRKKDQHNRDMCNIITPVISDDLFNILNRLSYITQGRLEYESNLDFLLRSKLSVPMKYHGLNRIFMHPHLSRNSKLFIIEGYIIAYKNYKTTRELSFYATIKDLAEGSGLSITTIYNIIAEIEKRGKFLSIKRKHIYYDGMYNKLVYQFILDLDLLPLWAENVD